MTAAREQYEKIPGGAEKARAAGFFLSGRYDDALAVYDALLEKMPGDLVLMTNRALCLAELERLDDGVLSFFLEHIEEVPAETLLFLAEASWAEKRTSDALRLADAVIALDERNVTAYLLKGEILEETGEGDELLALMRDVFPRFKDDERVLCFAAGYAADFGNLRQARYLLRRAMKINRPYVLQNERFYDYFISNEEEKKIIPHALEALEYQPDSRPVLRAAAAAYALSGKCAEADGMFGRLSEQYGGKLPDRLLSMWADALAGMKDYARAFDTARRISPEYEYRDGLFLFQRKMLYFLKVSGASAAAEKRAAEWAAECPGNVGVAHACAAVLERRKTPTPPPAYAEEFFDAFSAEFDRSLERLDYQGPFLAAKILKDAGVSPEENRSLLDAGCGTGLLASSLRPYAGAQGKLTGVDISGRMLDMARQKVVYDVLERADIVTYMNAHPEAFDLVACMDVFSYFGDLAVPLEAFARTLKDRGLAVFSVLKDKDPEADSFSLQLSGQYAHALPYVRVVLEKAGFETLEEQEHILRREMNAPVSAYVFLVRKKA